MGDLLQSFVIMLQLFLQLKITATLCMLGLDRRQSFVLVDLSEVGFWFLFGLYRIAAVKRY